MFTVQGLFLVCTHVINYINIQPVCKYTNLCTQLSYIHKINNSIIMTMYNYGSWNLPQLKDELRKRKARISGRKQIEM